MPYRDVIHKVYEEYDTHQFKAYDPTGSVADNPRIRQILQLVGTGKKILDIGVSSGDFAVALIKQGNEVVGLDISSRAVEICRARGIEAYQANIEAEEPPSIGIFDVVLMLEIIEHLIDPLPVLRRINALVRRPSGFLLLSTPNAAYVKWRMQLLRGRIPDFGENRQISTEPRPYNLLHKTPLAIPDLQRLLELAGFRLTHLEPEDYGISKAWDKFGLRTIRDWLRKAWPTMFAGAVVVKAQPKGISG